MKASEEGCSSPALVDASSPDENNLCLKDPLTVDERDGTEEDAFVAGGGGGGGDLWEAAALSF